VIESLDQTQIGMGLLTHSPVVATLMLETREHFITALQRRQAVTAITMYVDILIMPRDRAEI